MLDRMYLGVNGSPEPVTGIREAAGADPLMKTMTLLVDVRDSLVCRLGSGKSLAVGENFSGHRLVG